MINISIIVNVVLTALRNLNILNTLNVDNRIKIPSIIPNISIRLIGMIRVSNIARFAAVFCYYNFI